MLFLDYNEKQSNDIFEKITKFVKNSHNLSHGSRCMCGDGVSKNSNSDRRKKSENIIKPSPQKIVKFEVRSRKKPLILSKVRGNEYRISSIGHEKNANFFKLLEKNKKIHQIVYEIKRDIFPMVMEEDYEIRQMV